MTKDEPTAQDAGMVARLREWLAQSPPGPWAAQKEYHCDDCRRENSNWYWGIFADGKEIMRAPDEPSPAAQPEPY